MSSFFFEGVTQAALEAAQEGGMFSQFPLGENEATIAAVEEKLSNNGNPMLEITFEGHNNEQGRYYIVDGEYKLGKLKNLMTSFNIPYANLDTSTWTGKKGVIVVKAGDPYNGKVYNKISHCRSLKTEQKEQRNPSWKSISPSESNDGFVDDIPF